ncbi:MAG: 50S ribosomal protein L6 [Candidatus Hydrogenedentota bacterium]|nr:MAG: 50S ribosomal protein L6 [Candidatus Hydrogenedentota bacterium]
MSRIGNQPIPLAKGVELNILEQEVEVKGPKGSLKAPLFPGIEVSVDGDKIVVKRENDTKEMKAKHGLVRSLINNCVIGVTQGFSKTLILQGTGYRAVKKGNQLSLSLGFSHEVLMPIPSDVNIEAPEATKVVVSGIDKQRVGQVAAVIRSYRPPEPYKGKGVRYENERIFRKAGKAGKK